MPQPPKKPLQTRSPAPPLPKPAVRRLRVYAFDPYASLDLGSAKFSHATISLAWEDPTEEPVSAGPVNEYLAVIDIDPSSGQFYHPIDLNAPEVLGQDGLSPSEGDPRFHQQMVFAVIMKTVKMFERALGRRVLWAPVWDDEHKTYVPTMKLRVYPHALREANAYYSKSKRALLFGYFNASQRSAGANWVFTALSHDIIVHETTHAILDGLHPRYSEPTSVDSLAFHEAFADIAALFSHFQLYEAVYDSIARDGGRLDQTSLLTGLAGQFAKGATGRASLREYIDKEPDPNLLERTDEPHDRGAILVAAVFDAFLSIYSARTRDLLNMAGVDRRQGRALHPDLVARLTKEATKSADHVLRMCIRALDYLPPVDVRFGEFLRAIVTADTDLIPDDRLNYRLAFVEAFRRRGIFPENCLSMSPDNLLWDLAPQGDDEPGYLCTDDILSEDLELVPQYRRAEVVLSAERNRKKVWYWLLQPDLSMTGPGGEDRTADLRSLLAEARQGLARQDEAAAGGVAPESFAPIAARLGQCAIPEGLISALESTAFRTDGTHFDRWEALLVALSEQGSQISSNGTVDRAWEAALGIYFQQPKDGPIHTIRGNRSGLAVEVHSVRTARRAGPDGQDIRQLVIEVAQRRQGFFDPAKQAEQDAGKGRPKRGDFVFRGGATLIIDLRDGRLRYVIRKWIRDDDRLERQRAFLRGPAGLGMTYKGGAQNEPFAMLHRH